MNIKNLKKDISNLEIMYSKDIKMLFSSLDLTKTDVKLCNKIFKRIDNYINVTKQSLNVDPINFNYQNALSNIDRTKFEIAMEIRKNVQ